MKPSAAQHTDYSVAQKALHWVFVVLVFLCLWSGFQLHDGPSGPRGGWVAYSHLTAGGLVAVLLPVRIAARTWYRTPPAPLVTPKLLALLAWIGQLCLYALLILAALSGLAVVVEFPQSDPFVSDQTIHRFVVLALLGLLALHFIFMLLRSLVFKDGSTTRMVKFWTSESAKR
jgi:cytochrome b561